MKKKKLSIEHTEEVRRRILDSAKTLLLQYGYNKTTIRMIVEHSGILTGSIYYLFKNKEDIFQSLFLSVIKNCIARIDYYCKRESSAFKYAAVCEVELKKMEDDEIIRDAYFAGYSSKLIFENMVDQFILLAHHLFDGTVYEMDNDECYRKSLLIKGAMRACIAELYFKQDISPAASRQALIMMALMLFGVDAMQIENIMGKIIDQEKLWEKIAQQLVEEPIQVV
jgi:AcrR family transcriptional regulator